MAVAEQSDDTGGFRKVFGTTLYWLGIVAGAASFFVLIQQGYKLGVAAPLQNIVATYNEFVHAVGELVKPLVLGILAILKWLLPYLELRLIPSWKHNLIALGATGSAMMRLPVPPLLKLFGALWLFAFTVVILMVPLTNSPVVTPEDDATPVILVGLTLLASGAVLFWSAIRGDQEDRARYLPAAFAFMSVPLVAIFFLFTNAGLRS